MEEESTPSQFATRLTRREFLRLVASGGVAGIAALVGCSNQEDPVVPHATPEVTPSTDQKEKAMLEAEFLRKAYLRELADQALKDGQLETYSQTIPDNEQLFTMEIFRSVEQATYSLEINGAYRGTCFGIEITKEYAVIALGRHQLPEEGVFGVEGVTIRTPKPNSPFELSVAHAVAATSENSHFAILKIPLAGVEKVGIFHALPYQEQYVPKGEERLLLVGYPEVLRLGYGLDFLTHGQVVTVIGEPGRAPTLNVAADGSTYDFKGLVHYGSSGSPLVTVIDGQPVAVGFAKHAQHDYYNKGGYYYLESVQELITSAQTTN